MFTDESKVLTAYSGSFAEAAKWADAMALIEPLQSHFVLPHDEVAFRSHKTARDRAPERGVRCHGGRSSR